MKKIEELLEFFKKRRNISDEEMELIVGGKGFSDNELEWSLLTLGIACAIMAIASAVGGRCGTAIE